MRTIEPRSLLEEVPTSINISPELADVFIIWKNKFEEKTGKCPNNIDYMYAGYILANPIVREKFKKENKVINPE